MKLSRHEDVLALHCCFVVKSDLWLVMPLMSKGSCYHVLRSLRKVGRLRDGQGLSEEAIATILRETLLGLDYIHSHGQIHRDIKCVAWRRGGGRCRLGRRGGRGMRQPAKSSFHPPPPYLPFPPGPATFSSRRTGASRLPTLALRGG